MNFLSTYLVPTLFALLVHALVAGALMVNWDTADAVEITDVKPYFIEATLVAENPHRVREREEEAATQAARDKAAQERAAREEAERERAERDRQKKEAEKKAIADREARLRAEELARQKAEKEAAEEARRQRELAQQHAEEAERERMEDQLARAVMDEQTARRAVTDDEKAMAYAAQIRAEIVRNWSRPPSARTGMQALLRVSLVPTGEVVDVKVVNSSGNDAFDRSAVIAVEKAERFVVPDDPRQFERNFREFEVLFRPEDLRL